MPGGNRHTPERHHTRQLRRDERGTGGETRELRSSQYAFLFLYRLVITCDTCATHCDTDRDEREPVQERTWPTCARTRRRATGSLHSGTHSHTTGHTTGHRRERARGGANKRLRQSTSKQLSQQFSRLAPHNFASMIAYIVYNQESCNAPRPLYSLRLQYAYASAGSARALDGQREHAHHIAPDLFARWTFSELTLPMHTASPYSHSHRRSPRRSWPEMSRRTSPRTHPCRGRR